MEQSARSDTAAFLRRVLPGQGVLCAAKLEQGTKGPWWRHTPVADVDGLAARVQSINTAKADAYMAMAGFRERREAGPAGGRARFRRTGENAQWFRSLWLDIDVKPGRDDAYSTPAQAAKGIDRFIRESGLPFPLVVSSGHGFHLYWPFGQDISRDGWQRLACDL